MTTNTDRFQAAAMKLVGDNLAVKVELSAEAVVEALIGYLPDPSVSHRQVLTLALDAFEQSLYGTKSTEQHDGAGRAMEWDAEEGCWVYPDAISEEAKQDAADMKAASEGELARSAAGEDVEDDFVTYECACSWIGGDPDEHDGKPPTCPACWAQNRKRVVVLREGQLAALRTYAQKAGAQWKARLNADWMRACSTLVDSDTYAYLQQLRNQLGPSWLINFSFTPDEPRRPRKGKR